MKFKLFVRHAGTTEEWSESYDKEKVTDVESATKFGEETIANFNRTLRSHEKPREFVRAEIEAEGKLEHQWQKQNSFTQVSHGASFDIMKCTRCEITGKRFGLSEHITRDRLYKAKKFQTCSLTSQKREAKR